MISYYILCIEWFGFFLWNFYVWYILNWGKWNIGICENQYILHIANFSINFNLTFKSWLFTTLVCGSKQCELPKIVIHGNEFIILFLTRYFVSWTHHSAANNHQWHILPLSLRTVFSDLTLWRHHSWSVTSSELEALALWCHISRLFLHGQIGANAIFTSE